jgi:hypothetical protein
VKGGSGRKLKAQLRLFFRDNKTASSISDALTPDNIDLPKGMRIVQEVERNSIMISIAAKEMTTFETLISTLDEFVSHVYSATQTLSRIDTANDRHKDPQRDARKSEGKSRK